MKSKTNKETIRSLFRWRSIVCMLLLLLTLGMWNEAYAQFDSGAVLGNIKDPTGATINAATVELLDVAKGVKVVRQTDSSGGYEFDSVQPGEYTISVTAPSFQNSKTDVFRVNVGARQRVDLSLKLGMESDTVTVSGAAVQLETDTSDRGQTVQGTEAILLPLNGRSYADLAQLVPGVRRSLIATVASNPPRDASYNVNGLNSMDNISLSMASTTMAIKRQIRATQTRPSFHHQIHCRSSRYRQTIIRPSMAGRAGQSSMPPRVVERALFTVEHTTISAIPF